jgi:hypothetical protein
VLNRKNALFAGHDQGAENWACIASLIETCKLNGVDSQAYFADVLTNSGCLVIRTLTLPSRNKTTLAVEALFDGEAETLTRKAIELAKAGDLAALRVCLDRIAPLRKDRPVLFELPPVASAADAAKAAAASRQARPPDAPWKSAGKCERPLRLPADRRFWR